VSFRVYLDSSALVKLVREEAESSALRDHLQSVAHAHSCALVKVEVVRTARVHGEWVAGHARELVESLELVALDDDLLSAAAALDPLPLRSLDAIHIAAAQTLGSALDELVTYDRRMIDAATDRGLVVSHPGL